MGCTALVFWKYKLKMLNSLDMYDESYSVGASGKRGGEPMLNKLMSYPYGHLS
jgi:hypothetical protein